MSAIPSSLVSFSSHLAGPSPDRGKSVASVLSPRYPDTHTPVRPTQTGQFKLHTPAPRLSALFALSKEPEDAHITGGTRSLDRRLLALDLYPIPDVLPALS